jgi:hypothetical protein
MPSVRGRCLVYSGQVNPAASVQPRVTVPGNSFEFLPMPRFLQVYTVVVTMGDDFFESCGENCSDSVSPNIFPRMRTG